MLKLQKNYAKIDKKVVTKCNIFIDLSKSIDYGITENGLR